MRILVYRIEVVGSLSLPSAGPCVVRLTLKDQGFDFHARAEVKGGTWTENDPLTYHEIEIVELLEGGSALAGQRMHVLHSQELGYGGASFELSAMKPLRERLLPRHKSQEKAGALLGATR